MLVMCFLGEGRRWKSKKSPIKEFTGPALDEKINECSVKQQKANNGVIVAPTKRKIKSENGSLIIYEVNLYVVDI